jgi:hypothetical protein
MITREHIAKALENAFKNFCHASEPATFEDALRHWTEFGCCGHLVAAAITRAVDILSGRIDLAWYHDDWSFNAPDEEPNLIAFILVDARTRECLTLNTVRLTPHVVLRIETMDDAIAAVGYFLSLLGVVVEEQISQGGDVR